MNISILIVTNDFENFRESFHNKDMEPVIITYQQEKKLKLDFILLIRLQNILINHVILDKKIDTD